MSRLAPALAVLAALVAPIGSPAQPEPEPPVRPALARRIVKVFDFERRNPSIPIPQEFRREQHAPDNQQDHPGFPPQWNLAVFDDSVAYRGQSSIKLPTRGGNSGLRLNRGVLPIFRGADYVISAHVRTQGLRHARAFLIARFLDAQMRPIPGSEVRSDPSISESHWSPISVTLKDPAPDAAHIQIDLELLQPEYFQSAVLPEDLVIWRQDRDAAAWFDELIVIQLPRVALTLASPGNVVLAPDTPRLRVSISDLSGEPLDATLTITDIHGRVVAREPMGISVGRITAEFTPELPGFGWYRATLDIAGDGGLADSSTLDFVVLPSRVREPSARDDSSSTITRKTMGERTRFAVIISEINPEQRILIPPLVEALGIGAVTIPLWDERLTLEAVPDTLSSLSAVVDELLTRAVTISFALVRTPSTLAAAYAVPAAQPARALDPDTDLHQPFLFPFLEHFGQDVRTWQFGLFGDNPGIGPIHLDDPAAVIGSLVPAPSLELTWLGEYALDRPLAGAKHLAGLRVLIPASTNPGHVAEHVSLILEQFDRLETVSSLTIVLETLSPERFASHDVAADLVKRAVEVWRVIADHRARPTLAINQPWTSDPAAPDTVTPGPELAAWRTVIDQLADRRIVGQASLGDDVRVLILAPTRGAPPARSSAVIAWRTGPDASGQPLRLELGQNAIDVVDIFGNRSTAIQFGALADAEQPAAPLADDHVLFPISRTPRFYEGVDVELLQFLASLSLEPDFLSVATLEHRCAITVSNPWPQPISGVISILAPGGFVKGLPRDRSWSISPRKLTFTLAPGRTRTLAIDIEFDTNQEAGPAQLVLDLEISAGRNYHVTHALPFKVGLPGLEQAITYRFVRRNGRNALVVEARYRNIGSASRTLAIAARAPGLSRQNATIGNLLPGQETARQFVFENAGALSGRTIYIFAIDTETNARINSSVTIK